MYIHIKCFIDLQWIVTFIISILLFCNFMFKVGKKPHSKSLKLQSNIVTLLDPSNHFLSIPNTNTKVWQITVN